MLQAEQKDGVEYSYGADTKYAEEGAELNLFYALDSEEVKIRSALEREDFADAMNAMADLRVPIDNCKGMEDHLPGLQAILVLDSGHFITRERPKETTDAMMWFFNSMLGSGLKIFDRSKELGLPTKPVKLPAKSFGVNSIKFD